MYQVLVDCTLQKFAQFKVGSMITIVINTCAIYSCLVFFILFVSLEELLALIDATASNTDNSQSCQSE